MVHAKNVLLLGTKEIWSNLDLRIVQLMWKESFETAIDFR